MGHFFEEQWLRPPMGAAVGTPLSLAHISYFSFIMFCLYNYGNFNKTIKKNANNFSFW